MGSISGRIPKIGRVLFSNKISIANRVSAISRKGGMCDYIGNGLTAYYRNDSETITLTSGKISSWADISGNGFHATQATAARRPTVTSNWSGTLSGLAFGTNIVLGITSKLATNRFPITMGGVWQSTSNSAGRTIFAPCSSGGGSYLAVHSGATASREINSNQVGAVVDGLATTNIEVWIATVESNSNPALGEHKLYLTTSNTQQVMGTPIITSNTTTGSVAFIGALTSGAIQPFLGGTIGEVFIMNRLMTTAERIRYCSYVQNRYGTI